MSKALDLIDQIYGGYDIEDFDDFFSDFINTVHKDLIEYEKLKEAVSKIEDVFDEEDGIEKIIIRIKNLKKFKEIIKKKIVNMDLLMTAIIIRNKDNCYQCEWYNEKIDTLRPKLTQDEFDTVKEVLLWTEI